MESELRELVDRGLKNNEIAETLGLSERTIKSRRKELGLRKKDGFNDLNDQQLDEAVTAILTRHPHYGEKMISGCLLSKNIQVQRDRVRESMRRVDPEGVDARRKAALHRRKYAVPGPNYIWHIDGNHKLIRWRIVVHGGVDGSSRVPVFLKCATNNKAVTMFAAFKAGVMEFGLPQKVRSDKGGENTMVCNFMISHPLRGPECEPFITGRSVHNQRIERFWRDLFRGCVSKFYHLFYKMEDLGVLNCIEEVDLAALHHTFLPILREDLENFRQSFMHHKVRTEKNRSPLQIWQDAVDDGYPIDIVDEEDLHRSFPITEQLNMDSHINVPLGLQLTSDQNILLQQQFCLMVSELTEEEDQINYYMAVKEFLSELIQTNNRN